MKRLGNSSDSLSALMSMNSGKQNHHQQQQKGDVYSRDLQSMFDGLDSDGCVEETSNINEKKRRLSLHQVKALEKNFEVDNKLEPERKVKLAQELVLQPRQVAVWFQNRRARWKTKQLERDYGVLKSNYDNLKLSFDVLQRDNESLLKEIRDLKSKLNNETPEHSNTPSIKEDDEEEAGDDEDEETELIVTELIVTELRATNAAAAAAANVLNDTNTVVSLFQEFTSSTDSDSSAILNDSKESQNGAVSSNGAMLHKLIPSSSSSEYHPAFVKMEEESLFGGEESCDFFSEEKAPTMHWYCPDQWT